MALFFLEVVDFHAINNWETYWRFQVFPAGVYIYEIVIVKYNVHAQHRKLENPETW